MSNSANKDTKTLMIFIAIAVLSSVITLLKLGFSLWLWLVIAIWIIIYFIFYFSKVITAIYALWVSIIIAFSFSMLISFNVILANSTASVNTTTNSNSITLASCTSTASDMPTPLSDWNTTIYSAKLASSAPGADQANNVRTFSNDGINDKTEANSLYARINRTDNSYLTGYSTAMELCDANNQAVKAYTTAQDNHVIGDNISASEHIIHKGSYLHGAGSYRADVYIKTTDNVWHLVDRLSDITVTE